MDSWCQFQKDLELGHELEKNMLIEPISVRKESCAQQKYIEQQA